MIDRSNKVVVIVVGVVPKLLTKESWKKVFSKNSLNLASMNNSDFKLKMRILNQ